jgi:hypothetical protein
VLEEDTEVVMAVMVVVMVEEVMGEVLEQRAMVEAAETAPVVPAVLVVETVAMVMGTKYF